LRPGSRILTFAYDGAHDYLDALGTEKDHASSRE
jgi:hypothetical protein